MRPLIDAILVVAVSIMIGLEYPALGAFFAMVNFVFATQHWKTVLLLGGKPSGAPISRNIKAGALAAILAAIMFFVSESTTTQNNVGTVSELWNGDALPLILALLFLCSLLMTTLITEKRKR